MPPLRIFKSNCHWRPNQMRASTCCVNTTFIAQPVATHMIILDLKAITTVKAPHMYNSLLWQTVVWQEQASSACVIAAPADKSPTAPLLLHCGTSTALAGPRWVTQLVTNMTGGSQLKDDNDICAKLFLHIWTPGSGAMLSLTTDQWPTCIFPFLQPQPPWAFYPYARKSCPHTPCLLDWSYLITSFIYSYKTVF